jgi:hypothetical protein
MLPVVGFTVCVDRYGLVIRHPLPALNVASHCRDSAAGKRALMTGDGREELKRKLWRDLLK